MKHFVQYCIRGQVSHWWYRASSLIAVEQKSHSSATSSRGASTVAVLALLPGPGTAIGSLQIALLVDFGLDSDPSPGV